MKWHNTLIVALMVTAASWAASARGEALGAVVASPAITSQPRTNFNAAIAPLLDRYCTDCHGGDNPKNNLSLEFASEQEVKRRLVEDSKLFEHVAERIRAGEMPPKKKIQPSEAEKEVLLTWVD